MFHPNIIITLIAHGVPTLGMNDCLSECRVLNSSKLIAALLL